MIFRVDDVSAQTNINELQEITRHIRVVFPGSTILLGVSFFSRKNEDGSVYPDAPFKGREIPWFYDIDSYFASLHLFSLYFPSCDLVSHGLIHVDHRALDYDAQEMSILTSCNLLKTKKFIPPFNRYDERTEVICKDNNIEIINGEDWKSLDVEEFHEDHEKWYFHAWRHKSDELYSKLLCGARKAGAVMG